MTKLYRYLLFAFIGGLIFSACRKDSIEPITEDIQPPPFETGEESGISGVVIDVEGRALQNVEVKLLTSFGAEETRTSDENGYYRFDDVAFDSDGGLLNFSLTDYFDNYKFAYPALGQRAWSKVKMIPRTKAGDFDSATGKTINLAGSAQIQFDAGVISQANGNSYTGKVNVYAHWFDPSSDNFLQTSPGDLRGINTQGGGVQLKSYGMMAVELEDENGNELQIKSGETAQLTFPVSGDAPNEIPLWYFDEESGDWLEEGIANLEGGNYIADIAHFSFWNCDIPIDFVNLKGRLVSDDGTPFSNQEILIESDNFGYANSYSNSDGYFEGKVPSDEPLLFQVVGYVDCPSGTNVLFEKEYNFSEDTDLGEIVMSSPIVDDNVYHISSALKDCTGNPVPNALLLVNVNDEIFILESDAQGIVSGYIYICNETTAIAYARDLSNGLRSEEITIDLNTSEIVLADIKICDESEFYLEISANGSEKVRIPNPVVYDLNDDEYLIYAAGNDSYAGIRIDLSSSPQSVRSSKLKVVDPAQNLNMGFYCHPDPFPTCANLNVNSLTYDATSNTLLGSISGRLEAETPTGGVEGEVEVSFFLPFMDEELSTTLVPVNIWIDENKDGIRDSNEPIPTDFDDIKGVFRYFYTSASRFKIDVFQSPKYYNSTNGTMELELLEDEWWSIDYFGQRTVTLKDQGSNDLLDSDFEPIASPLNSADDFFVEKGVPYTSLGIGLLEESEMLCTSNVVDCAPNGSILIQVSGGTAPYTYSWSNGAATPTTSGLAAGVYSVTITDSAGNSCEQFTNLEEGNNQLSGFVFVDEPGGKDNIYDLGIDTKLEGAQISLVHPTIFIAPIESDSEGNFTIPSAGDISDEFMLVMEPISGYVPLIPNEGNDESIDSDLGTDDCEYCIDLQFEGCDDQKVVGIGLKRQ